MNDSISRKDALDVLGNTRAIGIRAFDALASAIKGIKALPSAEKVGHWEDIEVEHYEEASIAIEDWQSARCSNCGHYHTAPYLYSYSHYNFCPTCGAKMTPFEGEEKCR